MHAVRTEKPLVLNDARCKVLNDARCSSVEMDDARCNNVKWTMHAVGT